MQFVYCYILFLALIFVGVTSHRPIQVRHPVFRNVPRYPQGYYYVAPVRRQQTDIERILRSYLWAQVFIGLLSPKETKTSEMTTKEPMASTTEMITVTTTDSQEEEFDFEDWLEHEGCRYELGMDLLLFDDAVESCRDKGANLAHENVRTPTARQALFADFGTEPPSLWLPLFDSDLTETSIVLSWIEGFDADGDRVTSVYNTGSANVLTANGDQSVAAYAFGSGLVGIQFSEDTASGSPHNYLCEYCPP